MLTRLASFAWMLVLSGCTGLSLGENEPGADTYIGNGSIAVDDRTEQVFVVEQPPAEMTQPKPAQTLFAIDPDSGTRRRVEDLGQRSDLRMLFPSSGILVMSEDEGVDRLELRDAMTFEAKQTASPGVRYHGTRMSSSKDWIAVADNTSKYAPIHIIDAYSLERHVVPHDGEWLEAMWLHHTDRLLAIVFYDLDSASGSARIMSWSIDAAKENAFEPDAGGVWGGADLDLRLEHVTADLAFSFTWVGISPDDRYAVFPVRQRQPDDNMGDASVYRYALIVLDLSDGSTRTVLDAKGPVGFTPDGSSIVSYTGKDDQQLLLIDVGTLEVAAQEVPINGPISYFVSHEGNQVVVAASSSDQRLVLYDVNNHTQTRMSGPGIGLREFVSRIGHDELWLVDDAALYRLDMRAGDFEPIATDFAPKRINILPMRDRLVMSDADNPKLLFFDPEQREVTREVVYGTPTAGDRIARAAR